MKIVNTETTMHQDTIKVRNLTLFQQIMVNKKALDIKKMEMKGMNFQLNHRV